MKLHWNRGRVIGILLAGAMLGGCAATKTLQTKALAPTAEEARTIAQAQLDQQAGALTAGGHATGGYQATGTPHFTTKVLAQPGGGEVYEVTATENVAIPR